MRIATDESFESNYLIYDSNSKFSARLDQVFLTEGTTAIRTPGRSPNAPFAEGWMFTAIGELLDRMLVRSRRHLGRVLRTYISHYKRQRPHRGLDFRTSEPLLKPPSLENLVGTRRKDIFGALTYEYRIVT